LRRRRHVGKSLAGKSEFALLLHDGRGFLPENGITVIADQLAGSGAVGTPP
jgi:hypothetical protein